MLIHHVRRALFLLLFALPLAAEHITQYPLPVVGSNPSATVVTADGTVWVSASGGIYRLDRGTRQFTRVHDNFVSDLILGPDGMIWFERDGSVYRLDPANSSIQSIRTFPGEVIWTIAAGHDGMIWLVLSTTNFQQFRLVRMNAAGDIVSTTPAPAAYYSERSYHHVVTAEGLWWPENIEGGLRLLTPTGEVRSFPLPFQNAYWLSSAGDFLWVAGSAGAAAKIGLDGSILAVYDTGQPLLGATADADGNLWIRELNRLSMITRDGQYLVRDPLPPHPCPENPNFAILAFSEAGELAITDSVNNIAVPIPQPCLGQPGVFDTVTIVDPDHGEPHNVPAAGPMALIALAAALALAAVWQVRR